MVNSAASVGSKSYDKYADLLIARLEADKLAQARAAKAKGEVPAEETTEKTGEPKQEVVIWQQAAKEAPAMTAMAKPMAEHAKAAVVGSQPTSPALFVQNSEGKIVLSNAHHPNTTATELPSALAGTEHNENSGDKKDGDANTYASAHKNIKDLRREALEALG